MNSGYADYCRQHLDAPTRTNSTISMHIVYRLGYVLAHRWWRGTVVERRSLTGELSLSCARPAADG